MSTEAPSANPMADIPAVPKTLELCETTMTRYSLPRLYADVCAKKPAEYSQYDSLAVNWATPDDYEIVRKVGRGKYCDAFQGVHLVSGTQVVVKVLKPVKKRKIRREIKILQQVAGGPNVVRLLDIVRDPSSRARSLVFEYIPNVDYRTLYPTFTDLECRFYLLQISIALDYCHSLGIIHRDVKPHNVMINHDTKELRLIDWGLAEYYNPGVPINVRVASRYYKGPELLVDNQLYDYSLDIWSLGCVMAGLLFKRDPFFRGADNADQLVKICKVLGTDDLDEYLRKYALKLNHEVSSLISPAPKKPWSRFVLTDEPFASRASPDALDLIDKMLVFDHAHRILPRECLYHAYFAEVRDGWPKDVPKVGFQG